MEFMMFHVNCGTQLEYNIRLALTSLQINSANHTNNARETHHGIIFKSILKMLHAQTS